MDSPFLILLDLLVGLLSSIIDSFGFVVSKLIELFVSLGVMAGNSIIGFIVAVAILASVILLIMKFVLGSSKTVIMIVIAIVVVLAIVLFLGYSL